MKKSLFVQNLLKIYLTLIIPLILVFGIIYQNIKIHVTNEIKKSQLLNLKFKRNKIVEKINRTFFLCSTVEKLISNNPSYFKDTINTFFYNNKILTDLILLDKNRKVIFAESRYNLIPAGSLLKVDFKKPYFIINEDNQMKLGKIFKGKFVNGKDFYIIAKISLKNVFKELTKSHKSYFIITKNGNLIYHTNYYFVLSHRDYKKIFKNQKEYYTKIAIENPLTKKIEYFSVTLLPLKEYPFIMGIETPYNLISSTLSNVTYKFATITFIFFLLLFVIVFIISKDITDPVIGLVNATKRISQGDFNIKFNKIPENELKLLFLSLKNMAESLNLLISQIKERELKLKEVVNNVENGIYVIDKNYNISLINEVELKYLNLPREKIIGEKCYRIFSERVNPCKSCPIPFKKDEDKIIFQQINLKEKGFRKDDPRKMVNISFSRFGENEFLISIHDITEVYESYIKIIEERDKLETTLKSIGDGVIVTDEKGVINIINREALKILEIQEKDAIGKNIRDVFEIYNETTKEKLVDPVTEAIRKRRDVSLANNTVLITKNGKEKIVEDLASPIFIQGKLFGVVLVFRDTTEKRLAEKELIKAQNLSLISRLAGGIAHDFNNILTSIFGNIGLSKLYLGKNNDKALELLEKSEQSIKRAKALTNQLLTFSKGGTPVKSEVSIVDLLKDTVEFALSGSNVKPVYSIEDDIPLIEVDKTQIGQVFQNIVINAKEAMPQGGNLYISVEKLKITGHLKLKDGNYLRISFKDEGIGMDKELIDHIFEPFFTTKVSGTGLGLAICQSIIHHHEGIIEVESEKGKGSTFYIYLPFEEKYQKPSLTKEKASKERLKKRILVIDDEKEILDFLYDVLTVMGYEVEVASNDKEAIEKFKEKSFDIAIIDLTLKGSKSGEKILLDLKNINKNFKAIVSSGYSDNNVMQNYKAFGFDASLPKPFTVKELENTLKIIEAS